MSVIADISPVVADDRLAKRNALVLAVAQALAGGNNTVIAATAGIIGAMLAPDKGLATLPISVMVCGIWLGTLPLGYLARHFGRRFALADRLGVRRRWPGLVSLRRGAAGLVPAVSGRHVLLRLLCRRAQVLPLRRRRHRERRITSRRRSRWVLAGGVFAGIIGSAVVIVTKDLWPPYLFAATFIAQSALAALAGLRADAAQIAAADAARGARPQSRPPAVGDRAPAAFIVAVACGVVSYVMMNMVMTSAPLAMVDCGHSVTDVDARHPMARARHVRAELLHRPSDRAVRRRPDHRARPGRCCSSAPRSASPAQSVAHFWIGLTLLGVGWNFAFIGATTLVTQCHRPEERNKVQSFNDFLIFGTMALGSFASGKLLATFGWDFVNARCFPPVLAVGALLAWLALRQRRQAGLKNWGYPWHLALIRPYPALRRWPLFGISAPHSAGWGPAWHAP